MTPADALSLSFFWGGGLNYLALEVAGSWPPPLVGHRDAHIYGHRAGFDGPAEGLSLAVFTAICANGLVYPM